MPKIKTVTVDLYLERTKEKDKEHVVALSFEEAGKSNFTTVMWLTIEQAKRLQKLLEQIPT